ncbi:MAG: geopeptide radical SAM maturase [bacterium]
MQTSFYLKAFPCREKPGYLLLFSTKQASKVFLKEETFKAIEQGTLSPSDEALLSKLGMIVHDREEEKQTVFGLLDKINTNNRVLEIMVVLNMDCNFSCIYCYEGDMKGKLYMSDDTAKRLIDFIKGKFIKDKQSLILHFYGGEPLLSLERIKSISRELKSFTEKKGGSFYFTITTNGSLFKRPAAKELVFLGLRSVKITLDGIAETHNKSRPFKSGAPSFDTIIGNIKETCDLTRVGIGGNFDKENYEKFVSLLDYLEKEGLTSEKISMVKFDPVMKQPLGGAMPSGYASGCMSINEPWLSKASAILREEILKKGYKTLTLLPMPCMVEVSASFVVNFDGFIYKCPAFVGKKDFAVGSLLTGITDYSSFYKLGIWKNQGCAECLYLPLCFGGCKYMTFIRDGRVDALDCKKAYLDTSLETMIMQDIKYNLMVDRHFC